MPSTKERSPWSVSALDRYGAGGEPLGDPPAPPPGIVDCVPDDIRRQLPDDVVDELLAGAKTEEEIVGPGGLLAQLTKRPRELSSTGLSMSSRSDRAHIDHTVEVCKPDSQPPKLFIYEPDAPVDLPDERPVGPRLGGEVDVRGE